MCAQVPEIPLVEGEWADAAVVNSWWQWTEGRVRSFYGGAVALSLIFIIFWLQIFRSPIGQPFTGLPLARPKFHSHMASRRVLSTSLRYERIGLKTLRVMSNIKIFAKQEWPASQTASQTRLITLISPHVIHMDHEWFSTAVLLIFWLTRCCTGMTAMLLPFFLSLFAFLYVCQVISPEGRNLSLHELPKTIHKTHLCEYIFSEQIYKSQQNWYQSAKFYCYYEDL